MLGTTNKLSVVLNWMHFDITKKEKDLIERLMGHHINFMCNETYKKKQFKKFLFLFSKLKYSFYELSYTNL